MMARMVVLSTGQL